MSVIVGITIQLKNERTVLTLVLLMCDFIYAALVFSALLSKMAFVVAVSFDWFIYCCDVDTLSAIPIRVLLSVAARTGFHFVE